MDPSFHVRSPSSNASNNVGTTAVATAADRRINLAKHGVSLALAKQFDWLTGRVQPARAVGGEQRWTLIVAAYRATGKSGQAGMNATLAAHAPRRVKRRVS